MVDHCDSFYDLCCDHGMIGLGVYQRDKTKHLYLNDQVKSICDKLKYKIESIYSYIPSQISLINKPCETIKFVNNSTICIAGVGYDTIIRILENVPKDAQLIISSHTKQQKLRHHLISRFKLLEERLVYEGGRFYEILKLNSYEGEVLSLLGNFPIDSNFKAYLEQIHRFHATKLRYGNDSFSKEILKYIVDKQKEF